MSNRRDIDPNELANFTRRSILGTSMGIGAIALSSLLQRDGVVRAATAGEANDLPPHFAPKVKRVIHICAVGGLSQVDSFDYKPELEKRHGQPLGGPACGLTHSR